MHQCTNVSSPTREEATSRKAEFIKQLKSPFYSTGYDVAAAIREQILFICLEDKANFKGMVLLGTRYVCVRPIVLGL